MMVHGRGGRRKTISRYSTSPVPKGEVPKGALVNVVIVFIRLAG